MTQLIDSVSHMREIRKQALNAKQSIGLVPTMGNLHPGHASLIKQARNENDLVILSVFINRTQFNSPADYSRYPRTLKNDFALAKQENVDYVFVPNYEALYPDDYQYKISENSLSRIMEGKHRPGHFDGVLTVVMKLLQISQADRAYFGEKDFQQLQLIKGMADAFFLTSEIIGCPTIRESAGLAFSSRNTLLDKQQLEKANVFYQTLASTQDCAAITKTLTAQGFKVDYIEEYAGRRYGAVYLDQVRLIDNIPIAYEC